MDREVLILTDGGDLGRVLVHAVRDVHAEAAVIVEAPISRRQLLRRRVRRLGVRRVAGQLVFSGLVVPILIVMSRRRVDRIVNEHGLDLGSLPDKTYSVPSANSIECHQLLKAMRPRVVVLAGTRILDRETLGYLADANVFNVHAGVTPRYRGVHGAYWALREGHPDLVGSTVHRVDPGIDTGAVVAHCPVQITREDSFVTYPYLQVAAAIPALQDAIENALHGRPVHEVDTSGMVSRLYSHPTIFEYVSRLRRVR